MRKLGHDITNSLVAAVSLVDLTLMKCHEQPVTDSLNRLRGQLLRPRATMLLATSALPALTGEMPRTLVALPPWLAKEAEASEVRIEWQLTERVPSGWQESDWVHVLRSLCLNALDAHAAARRIDPDAHAAELRYVRVFQEAARLYVLDNGPGCADLGAAASGGLRRSGGGHLGLGLAVVAALAERCGGDLHISPAVPTGLQATLRL